MNYPMYNGYPQMPMSQPVPNNQGFMQSQQQYVGGPQPSIIQERTSIPMQPSVIVPIESIDKAKQYPTAPGNTVFLKDMDGKHLYVKSMGYTQFDNPIFDVYIREDEYNIVDAPSKDDRPISLTKEDLEYAMNDINHRLDRIQGSFEDLKRKQNQPRPQTKEK